MTTSKTKKSGRQVTLGRRLEGLSQAMVELASGQTSGLAVPFQKLAECSVRALDRILGPDNNTCRKPADTVAMCAAMHPSVRALCPTSPALAQAQGYLRTEWRDHKYVYGKCLHLSDAFVGDVAAGRIDAAKLASTLQEAFADLYRAMRRMPASAPVTLATVDVAVELYNWMRDAIWRSDPMRAGGVKPSDALHRQRGNSYVNMSFEDVATIEALLLRDSEIPAAFVGSDFKARDGITRVATLLQRPRSSVARVLGKYREYDLESVQAQLAAMRKAAARAPQQATLDLSPAVQRPEPPTAPSGKPVAQVVDYVVLAERVGKLEEMVGGELARMEQMLCSLGAAKV